MGISENKKVRFPSSPVSFFILFLIGLIYAVSYISPVLYSQGLDEEVNRKTKVNEMAREGMIYFSKKSYKINTPDLLVLQKVAEHLLYHPDTIIYLRAHSWDGGSEKEEIALSEKRSLEVERFLTLHGVKESRIHRLFYGNLRPLDHALTSTDQSIQRRVEYQIITE